MWHTPGMAKRPRDPAQLAKQVFDIAIGEERDTEISARRAINELKPLILTSKSTRKVPLQLSASVARRR
jgi:hypothetical protein